MKRKPLLLIILMIISLIPYKSYAKNSNYISWEIAVDKMDRTNTSLLNMADSELMAKRQYEAALISKTIDTDGISLSIMGQGYFIEYDSSVKLYMTLRKELYPEQMKYSWETAKDNREMTRNSMIISLRGLYLGLYTSSNDLKLKQKEYELAQAIHKQNTIKSEKGMITDVELEESQYDLLTAKTAVKTAERNLENALCSFNAFIGEDFDKRYDKIIYNEKYDTSRLKNLDYYSSKALVKRMEVVSLKKQIKLMELNKDIIERIPYCLNSSDIKKNYDELTEDIEYEKIKLKQAQIEVERNINEAYLDVEEAEKNLISLGKILDLQKSNLIKLKKQYEKGLVSKVSVDQAQLTFEELENNYNAALYDYNTKIMKLEYAAGIGPAY